MTDELRIGDLLGTSLHATPARVVLIGFPSDAGVRINGGRPGAAAGPDAIRACLGRLTPDAAHPQVFADLVRATRDDGDLVVSGDVAADQEALAAVVRATLEAEAFPLVLGGGHETAYGHFLGHASRGATVDLLNWDAHPDVRPLRDGQPHSGSPFRQALEHPSGLAGRYQVVGLQPHAAAAEHVRWVRERGGRTFWMHDVTRPTIVALYDQLARATMVSFDLDAVDQAFAPGVSAPATGGLTPELWLLAARAAGRNPHVLSADIVELNPAFDRDQQTARLAALTVWHLLAGLAERAADR
ncbi:MAG: formimidoylglutamase [Gemmatimonadales bacterium]